MSASDVLVIGGGPAGLMAAEVASGKGLATAIYDQMPTVGRKFLMAGRGGLNITHGEPLPTFITRYGEGAARLAPLIESFPPQAVRSWCQGLGQDTFEGTSGRIFPRAMKASPLLRAWLGRLAARGVTLHVRHRWLGFDDHGRARFATPEGERVVPARAYVLALGGGSWANLGSDGRWVGTLAAAGCAVAPLRPANCGFDVAWSTHFANQHAGAPLKRIALRHGPHSVRGELLVTRSGLEGGAIYALSAVLREAIEQTGEARIEIDLRPDVELATLTGQLQRREGSKQSMANHLRKAGKLSTAAIGLVNEIARADGLRVALLQPAELASRIKRVTVRLMGVGAMARAISSAGGVRFAECDDRLMLHRLPGVFIAGEMLDWEAPTGGYLLQACLASGRTAGLCAAQWAHGTAKADGARPSQGAHNA